MPLSARARSLAFVLAAAVLAASSTSAYDDTLPLRGAAGRGLRGLKKGGNGGGNGNGNGKKTEADPTPVQDPVVADDGDMKGNNGGGNKGNGGDKKEDEGGDKPGNGNGGGPKKARKNGFASFKKGGAVDENGNPSPKGLAGDEEDKKNKKKEKEEQMADKKGLGASGNTIKEELEEIDREESRMGAASIAPRLPEGLSDDEEPPAEEDKGLVPAEETTELAEEGESEEEKSGEKAAWNNGKTDCKTQGKGKGKKGEGADCNGGGAAEPEQDGDDFALDSSVTGDEEPDKRANSTKADDYDDVGPADGDAGIDESHEEPEREKKKGGGKKKKEEPVNENMYETPTDDEEGGGDGNADPAVGTGVATDGETDPDVIDPKKSVMEGMDDVVDVMSDSTAVEEQEVVYAIGVPGKDGPKGKGKNKETEEK